MAPYGSTVSVTNSVQNYSSFVSGYNYRFTDINYLRNEVVKSVRQLDKDVIEVLTDYGETLYVCVNDYIQAERLGLIRYNRKTPAAALEDWKTYYMGDFASTPPKEKSVLKVKTEEIQAKPVEKVPEKNSLKKIFYHKRLHKK